MLLFALSIFLSAFLLFLVQPLIARIILPWFGGTASVWTTCLMFFQTALLGGYFYSHVVIRRLRPHTQAILHMVLLTASAAMLPVLPNANWKPVDGQHPTFRIVMLLAATVGIPYLLLSTTGPLLQAWYAREHPNSTPYRLYALSNAGSLIALLGYPVFIEPLLHIRAQAQVWSTTYIAFVLICALTAYRTLRLPNTAAIDASHPEPTRDHTPWTRLALWAALAFCPSALLVAITSHMTQNISPVPLLWVVPLALYLISFIVTFESERWYSRRFWFPVLITTSALMIAFLFPENRNTAVRVVIPLFLAGFFCCAVTCHGELYRLRPKSSSLTLFYLMLSVGGALGGLFVGILAPTVFNYYYELPIALLIMVVAIAIALQIGGETALPGPTAHIVQWALLGGMGLGLAYLIAIDIPVWGSKFLLMKRNFYGVLRVEDTPETDSTAGLRELHNGTINHGAEFTDLARHREPTTYYGPKSGVGLALDAASPAGPRHVGIIGLGAGTLAAYCRPGDSFRFYEINPTVVGIAENKFYFLHECPAVHTIALGDARVQLEREQPQQYDVLAVDAFSGDSIPIHLLTLEAFHEYLRHLKPSGVLAVHISNRYLDLKRVVARANQALGLNAILISDNGDDAKDISRSDWVVMTRDPHLLDQPAWRAQGREALQSSALRPWTDDYSSVLEILK